MAGKRNWLKQITRWIFESPTPQSGKTKNTKNNVEKNIEQIESSAISKKNKETQKIKSENLLKEAWKRFIQGWESQGYKSESFIQGNLLDQTVNSLSKDESFKNELIETLFKISSDKKILESLAEILKRGRVAAGDDINAIRAFAYISALTVPEKKITKKRDIENNLPIKLDTLKAKEKPTKSDKKNTHDLKDSILYIDKKQGKINELNQSKDQNNDLILDFRREVSLIVNSESLLSNSYLQTRNKIKTIIENYKVSDYIKDSFDNTISAISKISSYVEAVSNKEIQTFELIKQAIVRQYIISESKNELIKWNRNMQLIKSISGIGKFKQFYLNAQGISLASIARKSQRKKDYITKNINSVKKVLGFDPISIKEQLAEKLSYLETIAIKEWIEEFGRLPIKTDKKITNENKPIKDKILKMSLKGRQDFLFKNNVEITTKEYDYHYKFIINQEGKVGNGYWLIFNNLKEFLYRHSASLGKSTLMPRQSALPLSVRAVVTKFGGQKRVAEKVGLIYQGKLLSESEEKYFWTEVRLVKLLEDAVSYLGIQQNLMPSNTQIYEFIQSQVTGEYKDKTPGSIIYALTKQGSLPWDEVAKRFGRVYTEGDSKKEITLSYIRAFVKDLGDHIESLSPAEMYVLFQSQGINQKDNEKFSRTFDVLVDAIQSGVVSKEDLGDWANDNDVPKIQSLIEFGSELKEESSIEEKESKLLEERSKQIIEESNNGNQIEVLSKDDLPSLDPEKTLNALDKATAVIESTSSDAEKVEFLKAKASAKLWDSCFEDEKVTVEQVKKLSPPLDAYSQEVKEEFLEEYQGAKELLVPSAYKFVDLKGRQRDPKLMQRLVAYRLKRDKRLLNLSGTGTGKTLSAIFAAQVCGAKRILISCPNGAIATWEKAFSSAYPDANLHVKLEGWSVPILNDGIHVYLLNHERFQELYAERMFQHCVDYQTDLIVIDEIHQSKRRTKEKSSQRRKLLNEYICISSNINPELKVLGMSATPVINNLYEGRSLLELVTQKTIDDVDEKIDLNSCMNLYQHFVREGIRMNPGAMSRTKIILKEIDATSTITEIITATKHGTYHDVEQLLVQPKLNSLSECLKKGVKTIIFIAYIQNTLRPLSNWLINNGFSYCVYTGNDKEAAEEGFNDSLDQFINGSTEVLVASIKCVGTGVDGLQSTCNRAIFFQLPWTSTEFEQAVGRLDRDGTDFESVEVFLPITDINLPNGEKWSWCRSKLDRINSKRDIAKAAVDGEVPDAASMISPTEASKYWVNWLDRLNRKTA